MKKVILIFVALAVIFSCGAGEVLPSIRFLRGCP